MLLQLVPVWDSTMCGQYRSIVRMIGTNLPLSPYSRLRFQVTKVSHFPFDGECFNVNQLQFFAFNAYIQNLTSITVNACIQTITCMYTLDLY